MTTTGARKKQHRREVVGTTERPRRERGEEGLTLVWLVEIFFITFRYATPTGQRHQGGRKEPK